MRNENLKSVTVYFSPEEYNQVKNEADDNGVTVSALVRAKLGFPVTHRGAPGGNRNRAKDKQRATGEEETAPEVAPDFPYLSQAGK